MKLKLFPEKIITIRDTFFLTRKELAAITGFSEKTIFNWEHKNREPQNHQTLVILSSSLHIDIAYFLAETVDEKYLFQASRNFPGLPHDG